MNKHELEPYGERIKLPSSQDFNHQLKMVECWIQSTILPKGLTTPKAMVILQTGKEIGIGPMEALNSIDIIQGKPTMSAQLMRSQIMRFAPSAEFTFTKNDSEACIVKARRKPADDWSIFSFTMEDARKANLANKAVWRNYPGAMLLARCTSIMARSLFADCLMGVSYVPEELGAEVDEEGRVIDLSGANVQLKTPKQKQTQKIDYTVTADDTGEVLITIEQAGELLKICKDSGKWTDKHHIMKSLSNHYGVESILHMSTIDYKDFMDNRLEVGALLSDKITTPITSKESDLDPDYVEPSKEPDKEPEAEPYNPDYDKDLK